MDDRANMAFREQGQNLADRKQVAALMLEPRSICNDRVAMVKTLTRERRKNKKLTIWPMTYIVSFAEKFLIRISQIGESIWV